MIEELIKKYPEFFSDSSYPGMFYVEDGWVPLIEKGIKDLIALGQKPYPRAVQIKEKFGGLRWYVDRATPEQYMIIDRTERESCRTCEVCGAPGTIKGRRWLKATCEEHDEKNLPEGG